MTPPPRLADLPPAGRRIIAALLAAEAAAVNHKAGNASAGQSSADGRDRSGTTPGPARRRPEAA